MDAIGRLLLVVAPLLLVAGCSYSYPYELTVTVLSLAGGTPIADVNVTLVSDTGEETSTTTGANGTCKLETELDPHDFASDGAGSYVLRADAESGWRLQASYGGSEYSVSCPQSPEPSEGDGTLVAASILLALDVQQKN